MQPWHLDLALTYLALLCDFFDFIFSQLVIECLQFFFTPPSNMLNILFIELLMRVY